jgi:hypothetical protein
MQFFLYLIVGGLSFFDIAAFIGLARSIPPSVMSFRLATAANYLLTVVLAVAAFVATLKAAAPRRR